MTLELFGKYEPILDPESSGRIIYAFQLNVKAISRLGYLKLVLRVYDRAF